MTDESEYEPNSRDITDDPNFLAPRCGVCGVPWADHMGIMGVCFWNKALKEDLVNLGKDNAQLYKERDEARRLYCMEKANPPPVNYSHPVSHNAVASHHNWDCFEKEETP